MTLLATQNSTFIIGDVAKILGWIMNAIFNVLNNFFGIQNVGLCIILFTIIIYLFMFPLTYKQQKFSKLSAKMNPEIQAVQKKYKGKQDQASMMALNEETKAIYAKYGVSASGSCIQLLIQMPILFALYRVIYNIPAYITGVKNVFLPLVDKIQAIDTNHAIMEEIGKSVAISSSKFDFAEANTIVDVLNKLQTSGWTTLSEKFPQLSELIVSTQSEINHMNNFFGVNIANSPATLLRSGSIAIMIAAIMIPVLAAATQWLNVKLMPQMSSGAEGEENVMASSMKQMNMMMPIMSAVFCFTLPSGLGFYWIMSALVRSIQQFFLNKHFDKMDLDEIVKKNLEKINEKRAKQGLPPQKINNMAKTNVRNIDTDKSEEKKKEVQEKRQQDVKNSTAYYNQNAKPGSIASKANMVKQYEEKNNKK